jgi:hypothetical protein
MSRHGSGFDIDEAILIAEYHDGVAGVLDAYRQSSRANTADRPQDAPTPGWDA